MNFESHLWLWALLLFVVPPLLVAAVNRLVRKRRVFDVNLLLAWFVAVCWLFAIGVILLAVL
ncbi:hypothetical protein OK348_00745 [Flavobacterium sp. MXW15]|uniref:Superinfection immunity protein n=1 Tax=Xanthomonas chitinilytica TaxID=2989819 RepID=A0ABT3JV18_9XANT|nr:hypothetical protein [Xanthomonas sp. H13-6]MCW4453329.1 hypothetical protein [Flavobacterium sp. MXW15]MCW4472318.1 hypothetical protein [Xanthomonas sp. H13-6]